MLLPLFPSGRVFWRHLYLSRPVSFPIAHRALLRAIQDTSSSNTAAAAAAATRALPIQRLAMAQLPQRPRRLLQQLLLLLLQAPGAACTSLLPRHNSSRVRWDLPPPLLLQLRLKLALLLCRHRALQGTRRTLATRRQPCVHMPHERAGHLSTALLPGQALHTPPLPRQTLMRTLGTPRASSQLASLRCPKTGPLAGGNEARTSL
mmetsp:Transcript_17745/g.38017  ORF Transcript_17745/g.38017 Transcript_17745/m.38017 type:complete len:205 (-) Transcript_17745:304-918(-)